LKIAIRGQAAYVEVFRELLSPWKVSFSTFDEADVVIVYGEKPLETKKTIVIPSDSGDFMKWIKDGKLRVSRKRGVRVFAAASSQVVLTITPQVLQFYGGLAKSAPRDTATTAIELNENLILLTLDIVKEYYRILDETMNAKTSTVYRLLTGSPIPYTLAPKRLRDLLMRGHSGQESLTFCDKLPLDALRFILVGAIETLSEKKLQRKTWSGKRYACLITHDVETRSGLQKARGIKKLEDNYNVPSAWYIPSKQYSLDHEIVKELANYGEIGAHDTWHDGELIRLPEQKLVKRLREAKGALEKIIKCSVEGFRAPLLQHSPTILRGLNEAGYIYDTSIPTWEPKHPRTMRPHGVGTTYPLFFDTVTEIPLSTVQDCQLLYTLGLEPKEVIAKWFSMMAVIKELGGCCVFLSHPEYKLFDRSNLTVYEELLNNVTSDEQVWLGTPKQLAYEAGK
jgi:hypothetical protein